jgi:hypothetical protein
MMMNKNDTSCRNRVSLLEEGTEIKMKINNEDSKSLICFTFIVDH